MTKYCPRCGKMTETVGEAKFCSHCGMSFDDIQQPSDKQDETPPSPVKVLYQESEGSDDKYTPWEDKAKLGFFESLFETWKKSVFNPVKFYRRMPVTGGIGNPLFYGLILGFIGLVFQLVYQQFFNQFFDPSQWYPFLGEEFDAEFYDFTHRMQSISNLLNIVIFPFVLVAWFFIWSGIVHLILLIFGWQKESFEATFRLITYSEGPAFFGIVPFLGWFISIIWQTVLVIIGIREVHRLSTGQAVITVFLPLLFCCLCCCGMLSMIFGMFSISN